MKERSLVLNPLSIVDDLFEREFKSNTTNLSLSEDDTNIYVEAALPGVPKKNIEMTLDKGTLWIQGKKEEENKDRKYYYKGQETFSYRIQLPENVNTETDPKATLENGILSVTFEKNKKDQPRKISIS